MKKRDVYVRPEVRQAFEAKITECLAKCQLHHAHENLPVPVLIFRNIGGPAGCCYWNPVRANSVVIINPAYFQKPGGYDEQLTSTLPHEVAHHICDFIHRNNCRGVRPHGHEWARVMYWMGRPLERCHKMDSEGIVNQHERPYSYKCSCSTPHLLTARVHLKIQRDGRTRICKRCRSRIVYEGIKVGQAFLPTAKPVTGLGRVMAAIDTPNPPKPAPLPEAKFRVVTRLINGVLTNVRLPIDNL